MRQADFLIAAMRVPAAATPTRPTAAAGAAPASAGGFGSLMREVQGEVGDFIEHGGAENATPLGGLSAEGQALRALAPAATSDAEQQQFLAGIAPWAAQAGARLGVAPHLVAAHAALESGWGKRPLRQPDGADSNNLFGIKAGAAWQGEATAAATTEYEGGAALARTERFRSYPDRRAAFRDYAQLLLDNPRYHAALNTGGDAHAFAQGLARGGYATDPAYAAKLVRVAGQLRPHMATALQGGD